ncbi:MAG: heme NO-binding domain-containing protein [Pseudomonadota bacterium]
MGRDPRRRREPDAEFETLSGYDDAATWRLVGAIRKRFEPSPAQALFGTRWIAFAHRFPVGRPMRFAGRTLEAQLRGLDERHERIKAAMPHPEPPSFDREEGDDGTLRRH